MKLPYSLKILHPSTLTAMLSWNYPVCHLFTWSLPACAPHKLEPFLGVCRISEPRMAPGCRKGLRTACRRKERREETGGNVCAEHTCMSLTTEFMSTCLAAGILSVPFTSMGSGSLNILVILVKVTWPEYPSHCLLTSHSSLAQDWPFTFQESYMFLNMTSWSRQDILLYMEELSISFYLNATERWSKEQLNSPQLSEPEPSPLL